jgi:hypothetical protein
MKKFFLKIVPIMRILIFFGACALLAAKSVLLAKILWSQNCTGKAICFYMC